MPLASATSYCGPPPRPEGLAAAWNFDPPLLVGLAILLAVLVARARRRDALPGRRVRSRLATAAGWSLLAAIFLSPLCALGVALFSARVGQHLLLVDVAAPLLVAGGAVSRGLLAAEPERARSTAAVAAPGLLFAAAFWGWHAPAPYDATLRSDVAYWAMHLSLLGAACWLWSRLRSAPPMARLALGVGTSLQMGLLGALLVVSPRPLYAAHLLTTEAWGLSPVADQALGGVLCWTLGCLPFAAVGVAGVLPWLRSSRVGGGEIDDGATPSAAAWPPNRPLSP